MSFDSLLRLKRKREDLQGLVGLVERNFPEYYKKLCDEFVTKFKRQPDETPECYCYRFGQYVEHVLDDLLRNRYESKGE